MSHCCTTCQIQDQYSIRKTGKDNGVVAQDKQAMRSIIFKKILIRYQIKFIFIEKEIVLPLKLNHLHQKE